jgi:hypothetical protein
MCEKERKEKKVKRREKRIEQRGKERIQNIRVK